MSPTLPLSVATTKHTCGGPVFGRLTAGCPRCDELIAGAAPVVQAWRGQRQRDEDNQRRWTREHFSSAAHRTGGCGPVCTFGEW